MPLIQSSQLSRQFCIPNSLCNPLKKSCSHPAFIQQEKTDDSEENEEETGTAESGTTGTQGTDADIKEEKAPKTAYDNDDSLDLDSEEYDLDGF